MRKIILLFSVIISFAFAAFAENQTEVLMGIHEISNKDSNTNINRSIVQLPILNVVYDSDAKNIKITSSESVEAIVYIYDHNGNIVSYSNTLNTILQLPSAGSYTIYVEGEGWYGIGYIN